MAKNGKKWQKMLKNGSFAEKTEKRGKNGKKCRKTAHLPKKQPKSGKLAENTDNSTDAQTIGGKHRYSRAISGFAILRTHTRSGAGRNN